MGANKYFRSLSNRCCWLRNQVELQEVRKDFPQLPIFKKGKNPDPWDDYPRKDHYDCSWKRHRKSQWRIKVQRHKITRPKVIYDTGWTWIGMTPSWYDWVDDMNMATYRIAQQAMKKRRTNGQFAKYRVRFAYRRLKG